MMDDEMRAKMDEATARCRQSPEAPRRTAPLSLRAQARTIVAALGEGKHWTMDFPSPVTMENKRLWTQIGKALRMAATDDRARHPDQPPYRISITPDLVVGPPKMIRMIVVKRTAKILNPVTPTNVG